MKEIMFTKINNSDSVINFAIIYKIWERLHQLTDQSRLRTVKERAILVPF